MHLIDSLKTYGIAVFGWICTTIHWTCAAIEKITIILVFISVIVRLIYDIPKARESIRRKWRKKNG